MTSVQAATRDGRVKELAPEVLAAFRARLRGPLLLAADPGYDEAKFIWNAMVQRSPALLARCSGTADVVEAVNFAREHDLLVSIKAGGHNIAGSSLCDGGLTLDLSPMRGVLVDPEARVARVQAGCKLGDVDRETQLHGLAAVLGFVSETGVAGLTLGGGFGYLTRRWGWTVDTLRAVEVVTADGKVRRASREDHEDLFWALRGGGGNLGVVTSFEFELQQVGPRVMGGLIIWPADQAQAVQELYREVTSTAGPELTLALTMRRAPPAPFIPAEWHGKPVVGIVACHTGDLAQAKRDLARLKGFGKPIADVLVEKTYTQQQAMLDATQPKGARYYWKSEYLPGLDDEMLATMRRQAAAVSSPFSQCILFHLGDAIARRPDDDGAVGNRDARYVLNVAGMWKDGPDAPHVQWVRDCWTALKPYSTGGVYINFQTQDEDAERIRAAYGKNFDRLAQVKAKYDPANLFRVNRNVSPAAARAPGR